MKDWQITLVAMVLVATLSIFAIVRGLNAAIYYLGITTIAALGGLEAKYISSRTRKE